MWVRTQRSKWVKVAGGIWVSGTLKSYAKGNLGEKAYGDNRNKLEVFRENRAVIEEIARRKYLSRHPEPDGNVLIRTADISR
jgi:hypothetical protein